MKNNPVVQIEESGRSGNVYFKSDITSFSLWWEFAGGDAIAIVEAPSSERWEAKTGLPVSERAAVLNYIGEAVVARKVAGGYFTIDDNFITIYAHKP